LLLEQIDVGTIRDKVDPSAERQHRLFRCVSYRRGGLMATHWRSSNSDKSRRTDLAAMRVLIAMGIAVPALIGLACAVAAIVKFLR
jgi:hypothetical protein